MTSSNSNSLFRGMGIKPASGMAVNYTSPPMPPSLSLQQQSFSSSTSNYPPNIPPPMKSYNTSLELLNLFLFQTILIIQITTITTITTNNNLAHIQS
jgi:hypothetical protein